MKKINNVYDNRYKKKKDPMFAYTFLMHFLTRRLFDDMIVLLVVIDEYDRRISLKWRLCWVYCLAPH